MTTERNLKLMLEVRNYLCVNMRYEKLKQTLASEKKGTQYEVISMEKYEHKLNALSIKYKDMKEVNRCNFCRIFSCES